MSKTHYLALDSSLNFKKSCTFFKTGVTRINNERLRLNNTKRIVKYVLTDECAKKKIALLDAPMGYLSFVVYYARFLIEISRLMQDIFDDSSQQDKAALFDAVSLQLFNDMLWGTCNLIQFFWWTFKVSNEAGIRGMQLEVFAQFIDVVIMLINHYKAYQSHQKKMENATLEQRQTMMLDWHDKQINFLRSLIYVVLLTSMLGAISFTPVSLPIAPIFYALSVLNGLLRFGLQSQKNDATLKLLYEKSASGRCIQEHIRATEHQQLLAANQLLLTHVVLPACLYVIASTMWPASIGFMLVTGCMIAMMNKSMELSANEEMLEDEHDSAFCLSAIRK